MRKSFPFLALAAAALTLAGCGEAPSGPSSVKQTQAQKAAEAAQSIDYTENAEIDNIKRRLELTSKPGAIGFVVLLNEAGQPILYTSVKGKITSSGKRLTSPQQQVEVDHGEFRGTTLGASPSDEGTWGSSDPYIYFWDTNDVYHQWVGNYLYSDQPIRLRVEPLVIGTAPAK